MWISGYNSTIFWKGYQKFDFSQKTMQNISHWLVQAWLSEFSACCMGYMRVVQTSDIAVIALCVRDLEAWVQFWTNWRFSDSANTRTDYALLVTSNGVIIYIDVTNIMTIHSPANITHNKNNDLLCRNIVLPRTLFTNAIETMCGFWLTSPFTDYVIWGLTPW